MTHQSVRALAFCLFVLISSTASAQSSEPLTFSGLWPSGSGSSTLGSLFRPDKKDLAISLGINGASGNSETFSWLMGVDSLRQAGVHTWNMDFDYAETTANGTNTQKFARINLDYDRAFDDGSPWSYFAKSTFLADALRDFDFRLNVSNGLGYKWIDTDDMLFQSRVGFGTSREFGGADKDWKPELVLGLDYRKSINDTQECGFTVDYFPDVTDFKDYRLVADAFWQIQIKNPDFYLRLSAIDNYDSTPGPAKANDCFYGVQLLWKTF